MRALIFLILAVSAVAAPAPKELILKQVDIAGSKVVLELTNRSQHAIVISEYEDTRTLRDVPSFLQVQMPGGEWKDGPRVGFCGTGMITYRIVPGASYRFVALTLGEFPEAGRLCRVEVQYQQEPISSEPVLLKLYSEPFPAPAAAAKP